MPSDSSDRKLARAQAASVFSGANPPPPPPQSENLPCPRCDSTNTKFCYYNNYNLSQPRHFCKSCRRYWTQGGTLRNVPIGGGTRKNSKRSRVANSMTSSSTTCSTDIVSVNNNDSINSAVKVSECREASVGAGNGSFTSLLLSSQPQGHGFLGFEEMGFGFAERSTSVWPPYQEVNNGTGDFGFSGASADANNATVDSSGNAWQMSGGVDQESLVDGDCFAWPDLAISPMANGFK